MMRLPLTLLSFCVATLAGCVTDGARVATDRSPNVIVILADDMGYGDTSHGGHPTIRTPNLDRMASEGQQWTHFYAAASVCSPSRAALLTGKLPIRSGIASSKHRVFFPWSKGGLPAADHTLAELFAAKGYATALVGKWHLGHLPEHLPTRHGFDSWFGIPYSNDMDKTEAARALLDTRGSGAPFPGPAWYAPESKWFDVPLMRGETVLERAPDQNLLTQRYTEESLQFIRRHQDEPLFLLLAYSMPHVPLFRSPDFVGRSEAGLYGDVIEELDAEVGRLLDELRRLELDRQTLVVFTSDNGPWLDYKSLGGSAGSLRDGKSTSWEGGFRVPAIFWGPGRVAPGAVHEMGSTLDFMATFASLIGAVLPEAKFDSVDLMPVLARREAGPRDRMFFYFGDRLAAVRRGAFKAHFMIADERRRKAIPLDEPQLYDLDQDPAERHDLAASRPEVVAELVHMRDQHLATLVAVENQLIRR